MPDEAAWIICQVQEKLKKGSGEPSLSAGFLGLPRGLGIRDSSGWNTKPREYKDLENDPGCHDSDANENVVHYSFLSAFSVFSVFAALPFGFLTDS